MDGVTETTETTRQPEASPEPGLDTKGLDEAIELFRLSDEFFTEQRRKEVDDLKFEGGEHWAPDDIQKRKLKHEPTFVLDQTSGQVQKITNAPVDRIIVKANGGGTDPKAAEYWQSCIRRIENLSGAQDIYKYGRRHAVVMGRGFWRVRNDYFGQMEKSPEGVYSLEAFHQDARIEPILNQHAVAPDPRCVTLDSSDMRVCTITDDLEWTEFQRQFPQAKARTWAACERLLASVGDSQTDYRTKWAKSGSIRVAEQYYIEDEVVELRLIEWVVEGATKRGVVEAKNLAQYPNATVIAERRLALPKVKWRKFTAFEVLDRKDVPGRYIPVVQIVGERRIIENKTDYRGVVRMAKEPQRVVDFMETRLVTMVDQAAFQTWLTEESTIPPERAADWDAANIERPGRLVWRASQDITGSALPRPELISGGADVGPIAVAATRATMNLRHALGVPDVTPEEQRPEQSGRAIRARQAEQQQATSHYADSTKAGIRHTGRILMSMLRELYDAPRILRIVGSDEVEQEVAVYRGAANQAAAQQLAQDRQRALGDQQTVVAMLDVGAGEFDIDVQAGKGYESGRMETVEAVTQMVQAYPPMAPKAIPVLLENSDWPGASRLAKELQPPDQTGMVPIEEAQKAQQAIDALTQRLNELQDQIEAETAKLQSQERIAAQDNQTKLQIEELRLAAQMELERLKGQIELEKAELAAKAAVAEAAMRPDPEPPTHEGGVS